MRNFIYGFTLAIALLGANSGFATTGPFPPWAEKLDGIINLTSAQILVGNSGGKAAGVALSGDATIANTGALTIAAGSVEETMLVLPTADGLNNVRVARASFVCTTNCDTGLGIASGVFLPAKAVIIRSYFRITTQFVDGGAGTIALSCEDANNIKTATDITGSAVGAFIEGASTGTAASFVASIAATCDITLTAATAEPSAGALTVWVHYVIHD